MIDNLKDAIEHAKEVAEMQRQKAEIIKKTEKVRFKIRSKFSESLHNSSGADFDVGNIDLTEYNECLECASEHEQLAAWLTELQERRETEPIVYEVTENSQGFTVETNDDRNIGLKKVSTRNLIYAMRDITEKYWDEGLKVVFKFYCGNGDEWQKIYESEAKND